MTASNGSSGSVGLPGEADEKIAKRREKWAARAMRYRDYADHAQGPFSLIVLPLLARFCARRAGLQFCPECNSLDREHKMRATICADCRIVLVQR